MNPILLLSPHLDDAVFSCWHVLGSSRDVTLVNIFTAIPPEGTTLSSWDCMTGADDPSGRMRARLEEDEAALALAGRRAEQLDFMDDQYRDAPPEDLLAAVRARVPHDAEVYAPAAIGGHPDHELVRDVGIALAATGTTVAFYADLPYATEFGWPSWMTGETPDPFRNVDAYWGRSVPEGYDPQPIELSEKEREAKIKAMRCYRTQFSMLEGGGQRKLTHPELVRFELVWTKPA
jgi:LmbE family N-acetylglucosaminyl deacetylase